MLDETSPDAAPTQAATPAGTARMQRAAGRVALGLRRRGGATALGELFQEGCAKVRFPRMADCAPKEAILINTAGGLTGGDRLATEVRAEAETCATITTQACERIYRSSGGDAVVANRLNLGSGARLAWLPQETILFDGGRLSRSLDADLDGGAELLAVEATLLGRAAMGETVNRGLLHDRWRIRRDGRLIFADDLRLDGTISQLAARPALLDGGRAFATVLLVAPETERLLGPARDIIGGIGGASAWGGKLVARLVAESGLALRRRLEPLLQLLHGARPLPKVWRL